VEPGGSDAAAVHAGTVTVVMSVEGDAADVIYRNGKIPEAMVEAIKAAADGAGWTPTNLGYDVGPFLMDLQRRPGKTVWVSAP
jgi:hypothetical protein